MYKSIARNAFVVLWFSASAIGITPVNDPQHLALITEVSGAVDVQRAAGQTVTQAPWGTQLFEGDQVKTRDGATVSILFASNNLVKLGPNSSITIASAQSIAPPAASRAVDAPLLADAMGLTVHRTGQGEVAALGGLRSGRKDASIDLLAPRNTRIEHPQPVFVWQASDDYEAFEVKVFDADGLVWSGETEKRQLAYPADAPDLSPDREYTWQVKGQAMLDEASSPMASFSVLSPASREDLAAREAGIRVQFEQEGGDGTLLFMLGTLYIQEGLLASAVTSFEQIALRHPEAPLPHEILGRLYTDIGLKDDAIRAFQQAIKLGQQ